LATLYIPKVDEIHKGRSLCEALDFLAVGGTPSFDWELGILYFLASITFYILYLRDMCYVNDVFVL